MGIYYRKQRVNINIFIILFFIQFIILIYKIILFCISILLLLLYSKLLEVLEKDQLFMEADEIKVLKIYYYKYNIVKCITIKIIIFSL